MSLFCLVHGAYEGAWCWNLLIPELEARGHQAIALAVTDEISQWVLPELLD